MPLGWNEIRSRAVAFSKEWEGETREHAEAKTFWDDFFRVFGLTRRHIASFEEPVKKLSGSYGFIDLFWKGTLLAEHKSAGKDLGKAESQAFDYVQSLLNEGRGDEVPRYLIVSDFARIALHDLETGEEVLFQLDELHKYIDRFAFIPGYKQHSFESEDPINLRAVQIMGDLHDALEDGGYKGHELERMLVRILFCLFAEDTGIFERSAFQLYLENHTNEDGSDLGATLSQIFHVLNTPDDKRQSGLPEELASLPYVNGELFAEFLGFPQFNRAMRDRLLSCTRFDWSRISPAVFGALFQSVMEPKERRQIGAHYTSERDILKVIGPLFLDDLRQELARAGNKAADLKRLHDRLAAMRLFDPACGCGNFLVISYRELRLLELEILKKLNPGERQRLLNMADVMKLDVDQMFGIEIEEWPARIAEVAMWLMDHQMNLRFSEAFGQYFLRLPLKKSPHIHIGNALRMDWEEVLPASECTHVLGNPPFIGKKERNADQKKDMDKVWSGVKGNGVLDYVTCWYRVAADYIERGTSTAAFVSTNSISQGEQVEVLWGFLLSRGIDIYFAHRSFKWQSEARGKAQVTVVIIGFGKGKPHARRPLFDYEANPDEPTVALCSNINPYLVDGPDVLVSSRRAPLCGEKKMVYGSFALDDGNYTLTEEDRQSILEESPEAEPYIRPFVGGNEMLYSIPRYCLWLKDAPPADIKRLTAVRRRVEAVRKWRLSRDRKTTVELAKTPALFAEIRQPNTAYLGLPTLSSERRPYLPIGFLPAHVIASNQIYVLPDASLYEFGVLSSAMHFAWLNHVGGRFELRKRYSNAIVYNNFPWAEEVSEKNRLVVEQFAQAVLDARAEHQDSTLADLYDPVSMPKNLARAHGQLDRAVDKCYRSQPFPNERNRAEHLFKLYEKLTSPLTAAASKPKRTRKKSG